jgi:hypothetical protein
MRSSTPLRTFAPRLLLLALAVGVVMSLGATQAVAAPANDDRSSPVVIGNPPSPVSGDTSQATADPSDPIPFCSGSALAGTLWYSWTPSVTGNVTVDLQAGAGTVPIAAFFTADSSGNLTQVFCTTGGQATFSFTGGQTYLIMVGQYTGCCSPGPFTLTLTPAAPPPPLFLGYSGPKPGTVLKRTDATIPVAFTLADSQGTQLTDEQAAAVQTKVTLSASSSGSPVLSEASCRYNARTDRYQCSLAIPAGVSKGTPYYITAYRYTGSEWVVVDAASTSTTPNPEIIYFK